MKFREQVRNAAWQREFLAKPLAQRQAIAQGMREQSEARKRSAVEYADVDSAAAPSLAGGGRRAGADPRPHAPPARPRARRRAPAHVLSDWDADAEPARLEVLRLTRSRPAAHRVQLTPDVRLAAQAPRRHAPFPDALWQDVLARYPFLAATPCGRTADGCGQLAAQFLADKEFHGANGLVITDAMALAIAAQAVLPVLHLGLAWYDDFVGIVVHPDEVVARRTVTDDDGVVHHYDEVLAGEAMEGGPVMLNWPTWTARAPPPSRLQRGDPRVHPQDRHARRRAGRLPAAALAAARASAGWQ